MVEVRARENSEPFGGGNRRRAIDVVCLARDMNRGLFRRVKTYARGRRAQNGPGSVDIGKNRGKK